MGVKACWEKMQERMGEESEETAVANNFFQSVLLKRESKQKGNSWRAVRSKEFACFFTVKK